MSQPQYFLKNKLLVIGLVIFTTTICRASRQTCRINEWCRPVENVLSAEYKFINTGRNMTWFEALDECRREGNGSQLLSLESTSEQIWVLEETVYQTIGNRSHLMNYSYNYLWHVNAHMYLYNSSHSAWANGQPLNTYGQMYEKIQTKNYINRTSCLLLDDQINRTIVVENECLGLFADININLFLVNLHCTIPYTNQAICKRATKSILNKNLEPALRKFNKLEWVQSQRDERIFYRIFNLQEKSNSWYSARLLCEEYGAALTEIEDEFEFETLRKLVISKFKMDQISTMTRDIYFVNLHRYLYDTGNWSWGGQPNFNCSFELKGLEFLSPDNCDLMLCGCLMQFNLERLDLIPGSYTSVVSLALIPTYCFKKWGNKSLKFNLNAICKKRLPLSTTAQESSRRFLSVLLLLIGLSAVTVLFLVLLFLALTRLCLARARVCHPRQCSASGDRNYASESFDAINTLSYSPYPVCVSGALDEYNAGELEMDRDLVRSSGCIEISHHQMQNNVDSACDLNHEQSRNSNTDIEDYDF